METITDMPLLYAHLLCYLLTFVASYTTAYYYNDMTVLSLACCLPLGWSIFGFISVGHELYHLHSRTAWQSLLAFVCLDLWVTQGSTWVAVHNKQHHPHPWEAGEEEHLIAGNALTNLIHTTITLARTYKVFQLTVNNLLLIAVRLLLLAAISPYAVVVTYFTIISLTSCLTFIAHTAPVLSRYEEYYESNHAIKQVQRSISIFPDSAVALLLWGGFNVHTPHHLSPFQTRDQLQRLHQLYKVRYEADYCYIETWSQLFKLYHNRHRTFCSSSERRLVLGLNH